MSKRQSDYLSSILSEDAAAPSPTPTPAPASDAAPLAVQRSGMTLLARESALARVAAGDVKQVTELLLDPSRVRIWTGNPRHQDSLTEENCRDLIDAILAEGGQKVPAIVRRVQGDPEHEYEVIAGTRRHWSITWLRNNSYPDLRFLAQVHQLDDEAAFRLSDIENRARKDVSDFERARTYLKALVTHYHGKQARMAERLHISKGWLSKLLTVAALPDWAIAAFSSPADIQLKTCYPFAQKLQALVDGGQKDLLGKLQKEAKVLAGEQAERRLTGRGSIVVADVLARYAAAIAKDFEPASEIKFEVASGRTALSVLSSNRNGVSIRLHAGSGASTHELAKMFEQALRELDKQGRGLKS